MNIVDQGDDDECGDFGPTIELTPLYKNAAQKRNVRDLLWKGEQAHPEFARTLCAAAKRALADALRQQLGESTVADLQLHFFARVHAWTDQGDGLPENFELGVESGAPGEDIDENLTAEMFTRIMDTTALPSTTEALIAALQAAIARYLEERKCSEAFPWKVEITGYGGG
ncbi:MAG: hypothetical protein JSR82_03230 [Verrucomicrobia bacterium]|nr:hypothetical protein [Verrucomicrobiota bacterium]